MGKFLVDLLSRFHNSCIDISKVCIYTLNYHIENAENDCNVLCFA
jgi:hypothetical protein